MTREVTSKRVAKIAGLVLAADYVGCILEIGGKATVISSDDAKALAASALTQTANRPKPKKNGRVKVSAYRYRRRSVVKKAKRK